MSASSRSASAAALNKNFFALTNLYTAAPPTLSWSVALTGGGVDGSSVALTNDGSKVYTLSTGGTLQCFITTGATKGQKCVSWTDYTAGGGTCAAHNSGPWIDYLADQSQLGDLYFGDDCGFVQRVNGTTGTLVWRVQPGSAAAYRTKIESSPVVLNGYIYVGDDFGQLFQLTNTAAAGGPTSIAVFDACSVAGSSAPCAAAWAVRTAISFDTTVFNPLHVYAAVNDYVFEMRGDGVWAQTAASPKHLNSGATGPMTSSPILDYTNGFFVYTGFGGNLYKITYPFGGTSTRADLTPARPRVRRRLEQPPRRPAPLQQRHPTWATSRARQSASTAPWNAGAPAAMGRRHEHDVRHVEDQHGDGASTTPPAT